MKNIKKSFSILSSLVLALAMFITGFGLQVLPKQNKGPVSAAPIVSGYWTDDIGGKTSDDDLTRKPYNNGRSGSKEYPYLIRTPEDLAYLAVLTKSGYGLDTKYYYKLDADIDLAGKNWEPIGSSNSENNRFHGAIDGTKYDQQGNAIGRYKISNLSIVDASSTYKALIGFTDPNGYNTFTNIDFEDVYISTTTNANYFAGLVAHSQGKLTVENLSFSGEISTTISGEANCGGVVGRIQYTGQPITIKNVVNNINITTTASYVGGIAGRISIPSGSQQSWYDAENINFENVVNYGAIEGNNYIGGILGYTVSTNFKNVTNNGNVNANFTAGTRVGGIIGLVEYKFEMDNVINNGYVLGSEVGGLVGYYNGLISPSRTNETIKNISTIKNSVNNGKIEGNARTAGIVATKYMPNGNIDLVLNLQNTHNYGEIIAYGTGAGLISYSRGTINITDCSNTSEIVNTAQSARVGGLVGEAYRGNVNIINSFNKGMLATASADYAGGLVGYIHYDDNAFNWVKVTITNSYNLEYVDGRNNVGGLIGYSNISTTIINSFNMGTILGNGSYSGGLIGRLYVSFSITEDTATSRIYRSYNIGSVTGGSTYTGGLIGYVEYQSSGTLSTATLFKIEESFSNAYVQLSSEAYTGGIIGRVNFTRSNQKIEITKTFAAYNNDFEEMELVGTANTTGSLSYDTQTNPDTEITTGSRILTPSEFRDKNTFEGYAFVGETGGVWAMPDERGNGNNGSPYLKNIAGLELTLVIDENQTVTYNAVFNEEFALEIEKKGQTFVGWSTEPNGQGELYQAGTAYILSNKNATLYAVFEYTPYYKVIVEDESGTSLQAKFVIKKDGVDVTETFEDDYKGGLRLGTPENIEYFLVLLNENEFQGWQVLKPTSQGVGTWYTISSNTSASFSYSIKDFITENKDEYLFVYEQPIIEEELYKVVGEFRFRASKTTVAVSVGAITTTSGLGTITVNGQPINFSGQFTHAFPEGTVLTLEANPKEFYRVGSYVITSGEEELFKVNDPANNVATYQIQNNDKNLIIKVEFVPVEYQVVVKAETRQGVQLDNSLFKVNAKDNLVVESKANLNIEAVSTDKYDFYGFKIYNKVENQYEFIFGSNLFIKDDYVTSEYLSKYLGTNAMEIVVVFKEVCVVNVSAENGGTITVTVQDPEGQVVYSGNSVANQKYEFGSTITVYATASDYYAFGGYQTQTGTTTEKSLSLILTAQTNVVAKFNLQMYEVIIEAYDAKNKTQISSEGIEVKINGSSETKLAKIGDTITAQSKVVPTGYRFEQFKLKNAGNETSLQANGIVIDNQFLKTYLTADNKIVVAGYFVKQYYVNISVPQEQLKMVELKVKGQAYAGTIYFDIDSEVEVEITPKTHYQLKSVSGVNDYERVQGQPNKFKLVIKNDRTLSVSLNPVVYQLVVSDQIAGEGSIVYNTENVSIGDTLVIMFETKPGQEVKSWKFNGIEVDKLPNNYVVENNSITITVTEEWLNQFVKQGQNIDLQNTVSTGMSTGILTVIIGVSVIVPTLVIILVIFFIKNAQQKKLIYQQLKEKELARYKYDTSSFIKDLREGKNVGVITEEDVKKEMKKRKEEKKNK